MVAEENDSSLRGTPASQTASPWQPSSSTHLLSPQRDGHHLPGHVHEMDGPLGHFPVVLGGEAGHFVHSLAHADHVCRERQRETNVKGGRGKGVGWGEMSRKRTPLQKTYFFK